MAYKEKSSGRFRAQRMIDGQRKSRLFDTKAEAKRWENAQSAESWVEEQKPIATAFLAANRYMDDVVARMVRRTYVEKRACFARLFKAIAPERMVDSITPTEAATVLSLRHKEAGGHAANKDRKNLTAWWSWGVDTFGFPEANPFKKVKRFPEVREPRKVPTVADMMSVLDREQGDVRTFLLTLLHTAARVGELFRLRWDDVDVDRQTVRLSTRKRAGGSLEYDIIPMTEELKDALVAHKRKTNSVFVFADEQGQPYTSRQHLMKRVCRRNKVPHFGFHSVRHLSASMLDAAGVGLTMIQAILRHKSATTTARYLHTLRGARVKLDEAFKCKAAV